MPRLPGISQKDAVRVFQKLGYRVVRESGHLIMSNGERRLVIPRHDPINAITMGAIARDAGLTPQQFRDLLNCTALSWLYVRTNGLPAMERRVEQPARHRGPVDPDVPQPASGGSTPGHPVALFCTHPQGRIDDAVNQGLSILAGLALGSSVSGRGQAQS
jgi:predicted RNA binding protein YcfA (HicA-like mRNA interferase family)